MSDQWNFFPCQMGEHRAFIFYDHGIGESFDKIAPPHLLNVKVDLNQPQDNGLPTQEEFVPLNNLEKDIGALARDNDSLYVGRITVNGFRQFYIYTASSEAAWDAHLKTLGEKHDYAFSSAFRPDDQGKGYWDELYPTADDWQVIKDMQVLNALKESGDDKTTSRRIDHWAYFPASDPATQLTEWLPTQGYALEGRDTRDDGKICVQFWHEGTVELAAITSHTIALRRKISELGGDYDGWETVVCDASE